MISLKRLRKRLSFRLWLFGRIKKVKKNLDDKIVDELSAGIARFILRGSAIMLAVMIGAYITMRYIEFVLSPEEFSLTLTDVAIDLFFPLITVIAGALVFRHYGPQFWDLLKKINNLLNNS